jgi:hypothetical protein
LNNGITSNAEPIPLFDSIPFTFSMADLRQITANLAKIRDLDEQLEKLRDEDPIQPVDPGSQVVDYNNIELQLLLEEMEQQQEISRRILEENQDLQRRLQAGKLRFEKTKDEIAALAQKQRDTLEKQHKAMEAEQSREDQSSEKEERRLQQSLDVLMEKNAKLTEQKVGLLAKLDQLKSAIAAPVAPKKNDRPS